MNETITTYLMVTAYMKLAPRQLALKTGEKHNTRKFNHATPFSILQFL